MYFRDLYSSLFPHIGGSGEFIQLVGEEYKVVARGREYHDFGDEYNVEKKGSGSNIIFSTILRLLGKISRGAEGNENWEENQD